MRKYIVISVVVVAVGVAASLYILPDQKESIAPSSPNQPITAATAPNVDYETEYTKGNHNFSIVAGFSDKKVAANDRAGAVKLWEEYVAANPNDVQGHKKLGQQYQLSGRQGDYNAQLEIIAAAEPTEANLRILSDIYNSNKEYVKQAEILKKIVVINKKNPQNYVDLATIQLVISDKDGALKTLEDLKTEHPDYASYAGTRIWVTLLVEKNDVDHAYKMAEDWVNTPVPPSAVKPVAATPAPAAPGSVAAQDADPRPKELADLCNILNYGGHPDKAVALVEPHLEMLQRSPELIVAYVNADIALGRADHAYALLQKIDQAGKMTPVLYVIYLDLALKREDVASAETIANKLNVLSFNEEEALNIIEKSRVDNAPSVTKILVTRFAEPKSLEGKPVLAAVIAILQNDKLQDQKIETALSTQLSSIQRLRLAEACARAQKTPCFNAIVKQFPPIDAQSPDQTLEYAKLYIIANRPKDIIDAVVLKAAQPNPHADVVNARNRLAAASGRLDLLQPWLEANANTAPMPTVQELFYIANDHQQVKVASDVAQRLYARDPSPANRDILINALVAANDNEKAIGLLREKMKDPGTNDGLYLATLAKIAPKDPAARKELTDYAQTALKEKRGDARQQLNYAYILINNGRKDVAIPYARSYASERGGEWKKMYAQLTQKPGKGKTIVLTREQRVELAKSPTISEANKRQLAFSLLHDGYKVDAASIFQDVAKDKGPDSQEVKDLLYIWGGKLNEQQLAWVRARAANASAFDKARWAELINNAGDDNAVLQYVSTTPDALYNRPLRQKYFRILAQTGSRQNYNVAMRTWVDQTTDVPALSDYAATGQAYGYREAAMHGYQRVLALDPTNSKALNQSAAMSFSKGKYKDADRDLTQYLNNKPEAPSAEADSDSAQAHFYKGELLRRQGNKVGAEAEYNQVVALTTQSGTTATDALSRLYTAQFRLGQHDVAKEGFNRLLAAHPDDKAVLADYMSALIEYRYLSEATRVANQYDKTSPYYNRGAALLGNSAHVASVEQWSNGRELKINFDQSIEGASPIGFGNASKLAWLEHSETGYDSISISAKPGYIVRYTPTSQDSFEVIPAAEPQYSPQVETQRQQDLRLQLLYARIEQDSGQTARANERVAILKQYYPNDPQLLSYEASLASASGDRKQAVALLQQAQTSSPQNEDLAQQLQNAQASTKVTVPLSVTGSNYAKLDEAYRGIGKNDEWITTASGAVVKGRTEVGFNIQNDFASTNNTRRASDGRFGNYNLDRQRGEVYGAYTVNSGERLQASVFGNNSTAGVGGYFDVASRIGHLQLLAEAHRPYWDFVEAVAEDATRDRVGVKDYANITPTLSIGVETSLNNYNIDLADSVRQTALARVSLVQQLQAQTAQQPYLGVGYGFDGEYKTGGDPKTRTDYQGNQFQPFPLTDREIHSLTGIYQDDWTPKTHARLVGGIAYNRFGSSFFPLADGRVDYDLTDVWQVGARARYSTETNDADNHQLDAGVDLIYKF